MNNIVKSILAVAAAVFSLTACTQEETVPEVSLILSSDSENVLIEEDGQQAEVTLPSLGGSASFEVGASGEWELVREDAEDWYEASVDGNTVTVSAGELVSDYTRKAMMRVRVDGVIMGFVTIIQSGTEVASLELDQESVSFPENGGDTVVAVITNRETWTVTGYEDTDWLSVEIQDASFTITASANEVAEDQTVTLVVTAGTELNNEVCELPVTIAACTPAYVTPSQTMLVLPSDGGATDITVTSNREWSVSSGTEWLTVSQTESGITVRSEGAPAGSTGEVVLTTISGSDKVSSTITVEAVEDPMILEYTVPEAQWQVAAPVAGDVNCYVDWGDGTGTGYAGALAMFQYITHVYETDGVYKVKIYGSLSQVACDNGSGMDNTKKSITAIETWGAVLPVSMYYGLSGTAIKSLPDDTREALAGVTNFGMAFYQCAQLESVPADMLKGTRATDVSGMFMGCTSLKEIPEGFLDGATEITGMSTMFRDCRSLTSIPDGLFDDMTKVVMANSTFSGCTSLTSIPEGLFGGMSGVTQMNGIFRDCSSLKEIPEDLFSGNPELYDISEAFSGCTSLESIPSGLFSNCRKLQYAISLFLNCSSVTGESPYDMVEGEKVHLYERAGREGYTAITSYTTCFGGCTGLSDYEDIPVDWK